MRDKIETYLKNRTEKGENFLFPKADWRYEVDNGDSSAGYDDWLETKIEIETDEVMDAIERLCHVAARPYMGDMSEIEFNEVVLDICNALRISDDEAADRARQFLGEEHDKLFFGETCGAVPSEVTLDISRIIHLGMVAYEGRSSADQMDKVIVDFAEAHGLSCDPVQAALVRLGLEDAPEP